MVMNKDLEVDIRVNILKAQKKISEFQKSTRNQFVRIARQQKVIREETDKLNKSLGNRAFAGYAMSIMFAGMALQRLSMSLYKWGTKAFQEINHSVEGTVTNTDLLEGSMKYLGFTIGQSLEPMIGWLVPIIEKLSEWVEANPEIAEGITSWGIGLGTLFMVGGSGALAINGFADLYSKIKMSNTMMGDFLKNTTGMEQLSVGFGLIYAGKAVKEILDGEILKGVAELGKSAGFFAYTAGNKGVAGALFGIGAAIEFTDMMVKGGGKLTKDSLANFMINNSMGAFIMNPGVGAALITIGVAMKFLPEDWLDKFLLYLGLAFGALFSMVTAIIDVAISPIILIINGIIAAGKAIGQFKDVQSLSYTNASNPVKDRIAELKAELAELRGTSGDSQMDTYGQGVPAVTNNWINPMFQVESELVWNKIMQGVNQ